VVGGVGMSDFGTLAASEYLVRDYVRISSFWELY
jgi:hypothetical protein